MSSSISILGPFPTAFTSVPGKCTAVSSDSIVAIDMASTCLPSDFEPGRTNYYSPGTACPSGYSAISRCTSTSGEETTITCCPTRPALGLQMHCVTDANALSSVWTDMECTWSAGSESTVVLVTSLSGTVPITSAVTMTGGDGINAYGLKMIYQSSDLSSTATSTGTTSTGTSSSTGSATSSPDSSSSGLSTGAKAAIGVVIPCVVVAVLLGVFFWYRRRKQRSSTAANTGGYHDEPKELPPNAAPSELYGSHQAPPSELAAPAVVSELPAEVPHNTSSVGGGTGSVSMSSPAFSHADTSSPEMRYPTPHS